MRHFGRLRLAARRTTFANVVSVVALVIAMGGTAYAAATIGSADVIDDSLQSVDIKDETLTASDLRSGSVGTSELARAAVRTADLAGNAVTTTKIRNGTIQSIDVRDGSLTGADVQDGSIDAIDLTSSARLDSRVQTFAEVAPHGTGYVVQMPVGAFTFKLRCMSNVAEVTLSTVLSGANFVSSQTYKGYVSGNGTASLFAINSSLHADYTLGYTAGHAGYGHMVISGIAPQAANGTHPAARVEFAFTVNDAGCTFNGVATDTTS